MPKSKVAANTKMKILNKISKIKENRDGFGVTLKEVLFSKSIFFFSISSLSLPFNWFKLFKLWLKKSCCMRRYLEFNIISNRSLTYFYSQLMTTLLNSLYDLVQWGQIEHAIAIKMMSDVMTNFQKKESE